MTIASIAEVLGGRHTLRARVVSSTKLRDLTRQGLPAEIVASLAQDLGLARSHVAGVLGIPERTLSRRIASGSRLTAEESDRVVRFARVLATAKETLGTMDKAARWLQAPNRALENEAPFDLLDTDTGVQSVESVLGRIAYGVYS
jgi:putative toxin-antitoxin system antitoxin component (TIGR02293 family)